MCHACILVRMCIRVCVGAFDNCIQSFHILFLTELLRSIHYWHSVWLQHHSWAHKGACISKPRGRFIRIFLSFCCISQTSELYPSMFLVLFILLYRFEICTSNPPGFLRTLFKRFSSFGDFFNVKICPNMKSDECVSFLNYVLYNCLRAL